MYQAHDLGLTLQGKTLLHGIHLAVKPGAVTVVVGPNGAGKSSLLKLLAGERRPTSGCVTLDGTDIGTLAPAVLARRRAVLPQAAEVAFAFSVAEVVGIGLGASGTARAAAAIEDLLARVDLPGFGHRRYESLSGGERQRVHLARVLGQLAVGSTGAPRYLLLDEPTSSLDLSHQLLVLRLARAHAAEGGGVLAVLHDLNLAAMVADHLVLLAAGRLLAEGPPAQVLTDAVLARGFGVNVRVNTVPAGPFILPQSVDGA
ncbi:MAG: heme ABC transporter ATP-binding protein [Pseudomonadota bacterium]|uniref:heme ABC transporter ATP-binding protein n=1 Tax=Roseixanthobacter finlandensis TaxID=3119922 RepID=UPI00372C93E3